MIKKNNKFFTYNNKIILTNGSSIKLPSIKYIKNYQLNYNIFKNLKRIKTKLITTSNKNKFKFFDKNI